MSTTPLTKVESGWYRTADGRFSIIREDVPSLDEFDVPSGDVTWFVVPTKGDADAGLPEALFEAGTRRACVAWCEEAPS